MDRVIMVISADTLTLTLGVVLKLTFSKLPASNVGRSVGVEVTGCRDISEFEFFVRVPWTVLEFCYDLSYMCS